MGELFIIMKHEGDNWVYDKELNKKHHEALKEILDEKTLKRICNTCNHYEEMKNKHIPYIGGIIMGSHGYYNLGAYGGVIPNQK